MHIVYCRPCCDRDYKLHNARTHAIQLERLVVLSSQFPPLGVKYVTVQHILTIQSQQRSPKDLRPKVGPIDSQLTNTYLIKQLLRCFKWIASRGLLYEMSLPLSAETGSKSLKFLWEGTSNGTLAPFLDCGLLEREEEVMNKLCQSSSPVWPANIQLGMQTRLLGGRPLHHHQRF